jgi:hypothetical protein
VIDLDSDDEDERTAGSGAGCHPPPGAWPGPWSVSPPSVSACSSS